MSTRNKDSMTTYKRSKCSPQNSMSTLSRDVVRAYRVLSRQTSQKYLTQPFSAC